MINENETATPKVKILWHYKCTRCNREFDGKPDLRECRYCKNKKFRIPKELDTKPGPKKGVAPKPKVTKIRAEVVVLPAPPALSE